MRWDYRAGPPANAPKQVPLSPHPHLIVALHSQCPCSLATLENLSRLSNRERSLLRITLVFTGPDAHHSKIVDKARALPTAESLFLDESEVLRRYGARTSGQVLLYTPDGRLAFSGGVTDSRGAAGDSEGIEAIRHYLEDRPFPARTPVYGCALQTARQL